MLERILFVVPYAPNLIRVRPYNLIRHLAERGHQVTVLTLWTDAPERESLQALAPYARRVIATRLPRWRSLWNCLAALPSRRPLQMAYCWEPGLARQIFEITGLNAGRPAFDVVHVEHLRGAAYGLYLKSLARSRGLRLPVLWDSVDSISMLFRQAAVSSKSLLSRGMTRFELGRTERMESWLLGQFEAVTVTSPSDQAAFQALLPPGRRLHRLSVLPNGVDLDYFRPDPHAQREPATLVVSGKMSYHANVAMTLRLVEEIMPIVWVERPETRLEVVGKDPPRDLLALAADPRIQVTGTVDHLPPYLQRATLSVAPIAYGAGIQNKVLEAMACGAPVVASPQAVQALEARPGRDLLVGDGPREFGQAILSLLSAADLRQQVGRAGRCYVERRHHWPEVASALGDLYAQISGR